MSQITTEAVRIEKELLSKIRYISKKNGQTISGYVNTSLRKLVEKDWNKFDKEKNKIVN